MGTFADLRKCIRALQQVPARVATDASEAIAEQIQAQFDAGTDPYGEPWAELRPMTIEKGRTPPPLTDSGSMRGGVEVSPLPGAGIAVTIPDPGVHHQYGYVNAWTSRPVAARPIFPNAGLPAAWKRALDEAADRAFDDAAGGLRA